MAELFSAEQRAVFRAVSERASSLGVRVFVVGGVVRDLFLGHEPLDKDIDFLIEGNAITFAEDFARAHGGGLKRFEAFLTAKIVSPQSFPAVDEIDFASARTETYASPGVLPSVSLASIQDDLKRRDFSINAMAVEVESLLSAGVTTAELRTKALDFFGGLADLDARVVRVLHEQSFIDDPTRIFRAARYVERLAGDVEHGTRQLVTRAVAVRTLDHISEQRKLNEIRKVLQERAPSRILERLESWGVLAQIQALGSRSGELLVRWRQFENSKAFHPGKDFFALFTALCAAVQPSDEHELRLRGFGLSKKMQAAYQQLSDFCRSGGEFSDERFSDEIVVAAFLLKGGPILERSLVARRIYL